MNRIVSVVKAVLVWSCLMLLPASQVQAAAGDVGVVFLHGKESSPKAKIYTSMIERLQREGYRVKTPSMPWSRDRIYDADVETSMVEIEREVTALRSEGAKRVVLVGHSMGSCAAIRYAVTRPIDAIVTMAPGHQPEFLAKQLSNDVARAREMIAQGKGGEKTEFRDINVGHDLTVKTTAAIYLSWLDPEGDAVMPRNAAAIKTALPVLMVVGDRDPVTRSKDYIFGKFPAHAQSRFVTVSGDHKDVLDIAADQVVGWINGL